MLTRDSDIEAIYQQHVTSSAQLIQTLNEHLMQCEQLMSSLNMPYDRQVVLQEIIRQDKEELEFYQAYAQDLPHLRMTA